MEDRVVNKIIAEFMGYEVLTPTDWSRKDIIAKGQICSDDIKMQYHLSLDALVPVWEKLDVERVQHLIGLSPPPMSGDDNLCFLKIYRGKSLEGYGLSVTQAAAHATAKAILELDNGN